MITRLTILFKGLILIAIPLCFQLLFIGIVARMRYDSNQAEIWTIHSKDVIAQAQRVRVRILTAHSMFQGYIITHDKDFEQSLSELVAQLPNDLEALRLLVVDRADQTLRASKIAHETREFLRFIMVGRQLVTDGLMDPEAATSRRRTSQRLFLVLDHEFDDFLEFEKKLDLDRHDKLLASWATFDNILIGGVVTSILFTVAMALIFARNISGRIINLTENARRLAESRELTPRIEGADEIARLDRVFHDMAATLSDSSIRERQHSRLLEQKADELAIVNSQLREKAQENEMFVYSVSHDLRSPLVNLQGFSKELQLIGGDLGRIIDNPSMPPELRQKARSLIDLDMAESINFIQTAVTRLSSIIDALLRLSRAGRVEYRHQVVEVRPIVERVVRALRGSIEERGATVEIGSLPPTWGDPTAIEQVFANLIGNAVNYLDSRRPGRIEVLAIESGPGVEAEKVVYAVRDNGLGISEQYKSKIFTAFQRLHGDVAKGEGVGLALVRRMVERHGGQVWFESEKGVGTTFFVTFPEKGPETLAKESVPNEVDAPIAAISNHGSP